MRIGIRRARATAALLCLLLIAATALIIAPGPARAVDDQPVQIRFTEVTVPISGDGTVVVAGTVTNTSPDPLHNLQAMVWRDTEPITTPDAFRAALTSEVTQPLGRRVCCRLGTFQDLTTAEQPLPPDATVDFRIELTMADLEFPDRAGAYLIGLHLRGSTDGSSPWTLGRARTFALRTTDGTPRPTVTSVVALSSRPSMIRDDVFADDHLAEELAPGGRLHVLLASAGRRQVSHAIDPALLEEVIMMSDGYQVIAPDGSTTRGSGAAAADEWLVGFEKLTGDRYRLPYAQPDLTALAGLPPETATQLAEDSGRAAADVPAVSDAPLLMLSNSAEWTPDALRLAERSEPSAVIVANVDDAPVLLDPVTDTPLVRTDPRIYAGGPGPEPRADAIRVRQRFNAEALVAALSGNPVPVRVINTVEAAALDDTAPVGTERRTLSDLLDERSEPWSDNLVWNEAMARAQLRPEQLSLVAELSRTQALFDDLLVDPESRQDNSRKIIGRGISTWWRGAATEQATFLGPTARELDGVLDGDTISLRAPKRVTLSMREGTTFPATISNNLDQAIRVRPVFRAVQGQRIRFPEQDVVVIGPGESVTVTIEPVAEVNGLVDVSGQLTTPGGHELGDAVPVTVEVTDLGLAAWVIVAVSGIVLVGTTTLRIRQVRARQAEEASRDAQ